jgi:hypothetical protein
MSPRPGGEADKFGNRYEGAWTVRHLLLVLLGTFDSITVEDIDELGEGAEFTLRRGDDVEVYQVKRQNGDANNWPINRLKQVDVWNKARAHVEAGRNYRFVSMVPARPIQELSERARASTDLDTFLRSWLTDNLQAPFNDLASSTIFGSPEVAWRVLRGMWIRCSDEDDITEMNATLAELLLTGAAGKLAAVGLGDLAQHKLGRPLDATAISRELAAYGLSRAQLVRSPALIDKVDSITEAWRTGVKRELLQPVIRRSETSAVENALDSEDPLVFLVGTAGGGKSAVLQEVVTELRGEASTAVLAFRIDRLDPFSSATELGQRIGLGVSPVTGLAAVAGDRRAILVVDQVDAVSMVSGRMPRSFDAIADLIREAAAFPNMRILLACRKFDVENDHRIRDLLPERRSAQVAISELSELQVTEAVQAMGLDPKLLTTEQKKLLHTPLNLVLLKSIAEQSGALDFRSARNLFDSFWERKLFACEQRRSSVRFDEVLTAIADAISARQRRLSAPSSVLDQGNLSVDAAVLISEHLLVRDGKQIAFFHESFFDYVFARSWIRRNQTLVEFLTSDEQELFRRGQVRQILSHLRDDEPERFAEEVEQLLRSSDVRFHIKDVVLAELRVLANPTVREWRAVGRVLDEDPPFIDRLWGALRTSAWFECIDNEGEVEGWLRSHNETDKAHALELMGAAVKQFPDRVAQLLESHKDTADFPRSLEWVVRFSDLHQSRRLFDLVLLAVRSGQYSNLEHDLWLSAHELGKHQPTWAIELLAAYLVDRPDAMTLDGSGRVAALLERETSASELIQDSAEGAPDAFVEVLLPYMLRVMQLTEYQEGGRPFGDRHFSGRHPKTRSREMDDALLLGAASSIRSLVQQGPSSARPVLERLAADPHDAAQWLLYEGLKSADKELAQWAADLMLEGAHRFLCGSSSNSAWMARELLEAISPHISSESFQRLEQAIMDLRFSWESRRHRGWYSFTLLSALDVARLSNPGRRRLGELQRFFGMDHPPFPKDSEGGGIGPPIRADAAQHMTDEHWLKAIVKHNEDRTDWDTNTGGAREQSHVLKEQVAKDPQRFAALAMRLSNTTHPAYTDAILQGLGESEPLPNPSPVFKAVRHIASLGLSANDRWLGWALRRYLKADIPDSLIELVRDRAVHATDPVDSTLSITSSRPRRPGEDVYISGINTARGSNAETLGNLLVYDVDGHRTELVLPVLDRLATDPSIAVRSCVAHLIAACLRHARPQAIAAFHQLIQADDLLLATHTIESLVMYIGNGDSTQVEPLIWRMLASEESQVREVGGQLAAFAGTEWAIDGLFDAVLDHDDVAVRKGAAHLCAARVSRTSSRSQTEDGLRRFANDAAEEVRAAAAEAAGALRGERLRQYEALLSNLIESPSFPSLTPQLLITLERAPDRVDRLALKCARRFVDIHKSDIGDIRTGAAGDARHVSELVIRAYAQADGAATRGTALDLIDELLMLRAYGLDDLIDGAERS